MDAVLPRSAGHRIHERCGPAFRRNRPMMPRLRISLSDFDGQTAYDAGVKQLANGARVRRVRALIKAADYWRWELNRNAVRWTDCPFSADTPFRAPPMKNIMDKIRASLNYLLGPHYDTKRWRIFVGGGRMLYHPIHISNPRRDAWNCAIACRAEAAGEVCGVDALCSDGERRLMNPTWVDPDNRYGEPAMYRRNFRWRANHAKIKAFIRADIVVGRRHPTLNGMSESTKC